MEQVFPPTETKKGLWSLTLADVVTLFGLHSHSETLKAMAFPPHKERDIIEAFHELKQLNEPPDVHEIILQAGVKVIESYLSNSNSILPDFLTSDNDLAAFVSITFPALDSVVKMFDKQDFFYKVIRRNVRPFTLRDNVIFCLCKLRLGLSFATLSVLFKLEKVKVAKDMFHNIVKLLAKNLKKLIYWPVKHEILSDMPKCFVPYSSTRVVLSTLVIPIQDETPNCAKCKKIFVSKEGVLKTLKVMLGLTPNGKVSFVSLVYAGSNTDEKIFFCTRLLEKLIPSEDAVMLSKDMDIGAASCLEQITFYALPKLGPYRTTVADVIETKNLTESMVYVERTLRKIKTFKILQSEYSWNLFPYLNDVIITIASLANLNNFKIESSPDKTW